jgi:hypothetical protein
MSWRWLLVSLALSCGLAGPVHASECGVMELAGGGEGVTRNMVVNLGSLLAGELEAGAECGSVTEYTADSFEDGCGSSESCVAAFAAEYGLELVISGALYREDGYLVRLHRYEREAGFFTEILQRRVPEDAGAVAELVSGFVSTAGPELDLPDPVLDVPRLAVAEPMAVQEAPQPVDPESAALDAALDALTGDAMADVYDAPVAEQSPAEPTAAVAPAQELEPAAIPDPPRREGPRLALSAHGGLAWYQQGFSELGGSVSVFLHRKVRLGFEGGAWIGSKYKDASRDEVYVFALVPMALGATLAPSSGVLRPFVGLDATLTPFHVDPDTWRPSFAVGVRARGGLELLFGRRFGLTVSGVAGFSYAHEIDGKVDPSYWPGTATLGVRGGVLVLL